MCYRIAYPAPEQHIPVMQFCPPLLPHVSIDPLAMELSFSAALPLDAPFEGVSTWAYEAASVGVDDS